MAEEQQGGFYRVEVIASLFGVAKTQETMVYAGPTILGVATHNQFFNNGLPDGLKTAMEKEPAIYNLVVPISNLAAVNADIASQSGAAYVFYKKAAEYKA